MIIKRSDVRSTILEKCHAGNGRLWCAEMLKDYPKESGGFFFYHDNVIEPGASIGEHGHDRSEEIYVILSGRGVMHVDGEDVPVGPGDICVTRVGHTHSLVNSPDGPMHFLVIGTIVAAGV